MPEIYFKEQHAYMHILLKL